MVPVPHRRNKIYIYLKNKNPDQTLWNGHCLCPYNKPLLHPETGKCLPCDTDIDVVTPDNISFIGMLDMLGKVPGRWFNGCVAPLYCGGMWCSAGRAKKIEQEGYIPYHNIILKNPADAPTESYSKSVVPCTAVYIDKLEYQSQCETCGGTWTGEWWKGTCTPPAE